MEALCGGLTLHSGLRGLFDGAILFEVFRDRSEALHLWLEFLKNSQPIPILLYNAGGSHKQLILEGELDFSLSGLHRGAYQVRGPGGEIFRFALD